MKKIGKITLIAFASLLVLALIVIGYYWIKLEGQNTGIKVADFTPTPNPSPTPFATDGDLERITGTPDDLGEDYYVIPTGEPSLDPIYPKEPIDGSVVNILLFGQDQDLGDGNRTGGRSDSMILLSYDRDEGGVTMVSLMRDIWTPIEGHGYNRLNAAYAFGGPGLAINTINDVFDLDVNNYVLIGFSQFRELIDSLGGIDIALTDAEVNRINEVTGQSPTGLGGGMYHLDGTQALAHARNRRTGNGDFSRTQRQRNVIIAMFKKAKTCNITTLTGIFNSVIDNMSSNMSAGQLLTLGLEVVANSSSSFNQGRVPFDGEWNYARKDGRSVIEIDFQANTRLLHELLYGSQS